MDKPLKILSLPADDGGCGWYRVRQPLAMIQRFTDHDTHIVEPEKDDMFEVVKAVKMADIILMRPGAEAAVEHILAIPELRDIKAKWVMDIDDNTEMISPYNYHYEDYGTEEYFDKNQGKWLWKDGQGNFNLERNRAKLGNVIAGLKRADLVTVTTPKLAEYARQYNPNVAVLPNCINFENWWKLPLAPNKQLRVGWAGGVSHYEDLYTIKEPLNALMRKYQFKLILVGSSYAGLVDEDNRHLVETRGWVPFKGHSYHMMCLNLDIALIPLADLPFNRYKSAVKWYEMSAMGIPSVVSNVTPYKEEIDHGGTAIGFTPQTFYKDLERLIKQPESRQFIGSEAQKWVKNNRNAKEMASRWIEAYSSVLTDQK